MNNDFGNLRENPAGDQPLSPELRALLSSIEAPAELLPWSRVVALVENAPPVSVPWYVSFFSANQQALRLASAPLLVLVLVGGMWAMPAQSLNVGSTVISELPADWSYDSPQFQELTSVSRDSFEELGIPQSAIRIMLLPNGNEQEMVMVLNGVDAAQAEGYYGDLQQRFPVLEAMNHEITPIETRLHENLLAELGARLGSSQKIDGLDENRMSLLVKDILNEAGFRNVRLDISRTGKGGVQIAIEADYDGQGSSSELSLEELQDAGYDSRSLGNDAFNTLNDEIGVDTP